MYIEDGTIYVKSETTNYEKEKTGLKCNTTKELSGDELKEFKAAELSRIVVTEIDENGELGESFERNISDVTQWRAEYRTRPNKTVYWCEEFIISWRPERRRGRPKMKAEEAVEEKRM
jgi:hypothetical protein